MPLGKEIAKGAAWMMASRFLIRILSIVSIFVLARLLTPEDFGIVALAMAMISTLELAGNFSFDVVLIQKQDAKPEHYNTVWTITVVFQVCVSLVLVITAYPVANFFSEPNLGPALVVLAASPLLSGLQNVRIVDFRKHMQFKKDFTFMLLKRVIGFAVTIPLAFYFRNYWALIIGTIAGQLAGTIISYALIPHFPRFSTKHWQELFHFSKWLFLNNIMFFLRYRASDFIIAKLAGTRGLGIFEISNQMADMTTTELVAPINRAVLPGLSKINDNPTAFGDNFVRIAGLIIILALPAGFGVAAIAEPLVHVALGEQWLGAIGIVSILAIAGTLGSIETYIGTTCVAFGRPDLVTKLYIFYVTILLFLTIWFTYTWGVLGAAWAWLLTSLINLPVYYGVMLRTLKVPGRRLLSVVWRPLIAGTFMFMGVRYFLSYKEEYFGASDALPILLAAIFLGIAIFVIAVATLWRLSGRPDGAEQEILRYAKDRDNLFARRRFDR